MRVSIAYPGILPDNDITVYRRDGLVPVFCTDRLPGPRSGIRAGGVNTIDIVIAGKAPLIFSYNDVAGNCRSFLVGIGLPGREVENQVRPDIVHEDIIVQTRNECLLVCPDNPVPGYLRGVFTGVIHRHFVFLPG